VRTLLVPCFREIIWMSDTSLKWHFFLG
jgi:hypothetical protein